MMDVAKTNKKPNNLTRTIAKHKWLSIFIIIVLCASAIAIKQGGSSIAVERSQIIMANVQQGDLDVVIDGYGVLTSNKQQLITTFSAATVKEIVLKPGAPVGALLMVLADALSRALISPSELPVGILTALAGGPFFLLLIHLRYREAGNA